MKSSIVDLCKVSFSIGRKLILKDISFTLSEQEIVSVIGPNGAGKSTLLKIILGLLQPTSGQAKLQPGLRIGYMPQKLTMEQLMPMSVHKFLLLANKSSTEIDLALEQVGLSNILTNDIQTISGGEMQRVLLARAILQKPQLLVLDEPVQGVDINGQAQLYKLIQEVQKLFNCSVILVSHNLNVVMAGTHSVICLNQHICCSGKPELVTRDPKFLELFGKDIAVYAHHDHSSDDKEM